MKELELFYWRNGEKSEGNFSNSFGDGENN